jgi:hypothetical protein
MRCVHRSYGHAEAEIVAGLLREEGCTAFVFENGLSRLEWHRVIAFGGFVVMVPDACHAQAGNVVDRWRCGEYCIESDDCCPRCQSSNIEENPNYRGWAFFFGCFLGLPIWPALKWRERCNSCGHRWKAVPPDTYAELSKTATETGMRGRHG